ncbi:type IV secretion system protein VirB10 [Nitratireductor sp. GCM10026969]|uniref:type IV secretion system protein VirB10 n=1 Tax=Nitratireductor sp. GCM10026969 TaxID=3252645 RepID=UPI0036166153
MKRSPELDALLTADESDVRDSNAGRSQGLRLAVLLAGAAVIIYFLVMGQDAPTNAGLSGDEEFRTTELYPSSFERKTPEPPEPVELPELPPPPEAPVEPQIPPPPAPESAFPARYLSGLVLLDESTASEGADDAAFGGVAGQDRNSVFLGALSALGNRTATARRLKRIDALVPEGTMIPGILETAINSDLPGQVRAVVSRDVYSFDGRRVLIPTGSRLIGEYQADVERGQTRVFVVWTRLLREDGVSVRLNSIGADGMGRAGLTGHVNTKFFKRVSTAMLLSVVGAGAGYLIDPRETSTEEFDPRTGLTRRNVSRESGKEAAVDSIVKATSAITKNEFSANLNIPPTISIPQGERIFVYVRQDLDFATLYDDPVTEALKEIKRERSLE